MPERILIRVFQIDYLPSRKAARWEQNLRAQFWIAFKYGN
jgi:hypothetical protein